MSLLIAMLYELVHCCSENKKSLSYYLEVYLIVLRSCLRAWCLITEEATLTSKAWSTDRSVLPVGCWSITGSHDTRLVTIQLYSWVERCTVRVPGLRSLHNVDHPCLEHWSWSANMTSGVQHAINHGKWKIRHENDKCKITWYQ